MAWQLRRAAAGDLDRIMLIENSSFLSDAWSRDGMRSELANRQCYYLVAFRPETPKRIEGYAGLFAPRGAQEADVQTIAVAEGSRREGLGQLLVQSLVAEARSRGVQEIFLEVRADNPGAHTLYASLGFERIAVRVAYYQPDGMDAIVMRLRLDTPRTVLA
ncbi:MAG: ribosomal protein S18-alanine N-acetyltransferase [Microbacteriaceae bacterium]|nr:ribosomal protein S18-alanine N-acetyltransferase [Microbacteriaceae bacterium]